MQRFCVLMAVVGLCLVAPGSADENKPAENKGKREFKATCVVSGKDAVRDQSVEYKGKKVYFCCGNCKAAYEKDAAKFANKANHQLFQTRQYVQVKCPLSGGDLDKTKTVEIGGVKVAFCCGNCQGKASKATGDDQVALAFADAAFEKGFEARQPRAKKAE
jgi:YHS domain-containing protein